MYSVTLYRKPPKMSRKDPKIMFVLLFNSKKGNFKVLNTNQKITNNKKIPFLEKIFQKHIDK